jgi:hypothetical protein
MSEYQYYEWQCIDRPLTREEQGAVNKLSSHITVSATGAWVDYSWGDFKHDPREVLAHYFDAFLYLANWGTKQLMFRFPQNLIEPKAIEPYLFEPYVTFEKVDDCYILEIAVDDEEPEGWVEGPGQLGALASLRSDILHGDYRCLYIAWLHAVMLEGVYDDVIEDKFAPSVPPGLNQLNPALQSMIDFFLIDPLLVASAAQAGPQAQTEPEAGWEEAIRKLPREEADSFLLRLAQNEPHLSVVLRRRLKELMPKSSSAGKQ